MLEASKSTLMLQACVACLVAVERHAGIGVNNLKLMLSRLVVEVRLLFPLKGAHGLCARCSCCQASCRQKCRQSQAQFPGQRWRRDYDTTNSGVRTCMSALVRVYGQIKCFRSILSGAFSSSQEFPNEVLSHKSLSQSTQQGCSPLRRVAIVCSV